MLKSLVRFFVAPAFAVFIANQLQADIVYSTNFNSASGYVDGGLIGQDGWAITGASVVNPIAVANTATNGNVALTTTGQDVNRTFTPVNAVDLTSIDFTADITVSAAQATGDYFMHLGDGGASNFYGRLYARSVGAGFQLALGTSSGTTVNYGAELAFNTPITINARYDIVSGLLNDTGALTVNGNPYIAATTIGTDATTFGSVNFRQGTAANAATLTIDNVVVNTTAIPEPTTVLVLGMLLSGTCLIRRRS